MNLFLAKKLLSYIFSAKSDLKIESAFAANIISNSFKTSIKEKDFEIIEKRRAELKSDKKEISVEDFGAGSKVIKSNKRVVKNIAKSSLSPKKYSQLLYRLAKQTQAKTILEMGTSLGISGAYLAKANPKTQFTTLEGSQNIAKIAQETFDFCNVQNAEIVVGNFNETLESSLEKLKKIDLAFIDGNHQKDATIEYFEKIYPYCTENSVLIFDDINWSKGMFEAWQKIIANKRVSQSVNIGKLGIVFLKQDAPKNNYIIKY